VLSFILQEKWKGDVEDRQERAVKRRSNTRGERKKRGFTKKEENQITPSPDQRLPTQVQLLPEIPERLVNGA